MPQEFIRPLPIRMVSCRTATNDLHLNRLSRHVISAAWDRGRPMIMRRRIVLFILLAAFFSTSPFTVAQSAPKIDSTARVSISGSVPRLATPESQIGPLDPSLPLERMVLVLRSSPEREQALAAHLEAQQDKDSPEFHKWLSPEQFAQRFGPS